MFFFELKNSFFKLKSTKNDNYIHTMNIGYIQYSKLYNKIQIT